MTHDNNGYDDLRAEVMEQAEERYQRWCIENQMDPESMEAAAAYEEEYEAWVSSR